MAFDTFGVVWLNDLGGPAWDPWFTWLSSRWTFAFPLLALLTLDAWRRAGRRGLVVVGLLGVAVGSGDQLGVLLKDFTAVARPCYTLKDELQWRVGGPEPCNARPRAMPSNHALNFAAAAAVVTLVTPWRPWWCILWLAALAVALSRVYLAKHTPLQVGVGLWLGAVWGAAIALTLGRRLLPPPRFKP